MVSILFGCACFTKLFDNFWVELKYLITYSQWRVTGYAVHKNTRNPPEFRTRAVHGLLNHVTISNSQQFAHSNTNKKHLHSDFYIGNVGMTIYCILFNLVSYDLSNVQATGRELS